MQRVFSFRPLPVKRANPADRQGFARWLLRCMGPKWPLAYLTDRGAMSYDPGNEGINRMVGDLRLRDATCPLASYVTPKTRACANGFPICKITPCSEAPILPTSRTRRRARERITLGRTPIPRFPKPLYCKAFQRLLDRHPPTTEHPVRSKKNQNPA